jgi:hypothetical protein
MLVLFLIALYGLGFYLFCAPVFWLILQFVSDRSQRRHATRVLLGIGAGLVGLLGISMVPEVVTMATSPPPRPVAVQQEDLATRTHRLHAQQRIDAIRARMQGNAQP